MNIEEYVVRRLDASEGHYLTESANIPDESRTITKTIYISTPVTEWTEISEEEGNRIKKIQESIASNFDNHE